MESKSLFLDLDGTLLNDQKKITPENQQAMQLALSRGHRIVIASGRPLKSALLQASQLGLDGAGCYVIAYNGGVVYDCLHQREVFRKTMEREDLYAVFDEANRRGVYIQTYDGDYVVVERRGNSAMARRYCSAIQMEFRVIGDVRRDLSAPPPKALLIDFEGRTATESMRQWILHNLSGRVDTFFSSPSYLEVVPAGINKGRAVVEMCKALEIPLRNAVAAGDEANDISMIRAAGTGVAMKNASAEVKAAADYVTRRDNNHDGIAEVIYRYMLG